MAQERMDDWWEYAKELAKAERELQIGHWVRISIEYRDEAGDTVRLHQGNCTNATAGWSAGAKLGCNACTLAGIFTPITVITTNAPDSGPISTPACRDCQRQRHRLPSRKGKRRSIWNTSAQTTCSSMKPPTGSCNSFGRNYGSRKKIIRHWKPKSVLR